MRTLNLAISLATTFCLVSLGFQAVFGEPPAFVPVAAKADLSQLPKDIRELVEAWAEVKPLFERKDTPSADEYAKMQNFNAKLVPLAYKHDRATFDVSGTVVDGDTDKPLEGVKLGIGAGVEAVPRLVGPPGWNGGPLEESTKQIDKTFSVKYDNKSFLQLKFTKEGYLPVEYPHITTETPLGRDDLDRLLAGGKFESAVVKREIKVAMYRPLVYSGTLMGGGCTVVLTPDKPIGFVVLSSSNEEGKKWEVVSGIRAIDDKTPLPKDAIVFRFPTADDGSTFQMSKLSRPLTLSPFPIWLEVSTVGEKSGIVQIPLHQALRDLPEAGYQQNIKLPEGKLLTDQASTVESESGLQFAFRRNDGKYGWIQVQIPGRDKEARVLVRLHLQKDGTRIVARPK